MCKYGQYLTMLALITSDYVQAWPALQHVGPNHLGLCSARALLRGGGWWGEPAHKGGRPRLCAYVCDAYVSMCVHDIVCVCVCVRACVDEVGGGGINTGSGNFEHNKTLFNTSLREHTQTH